MRDDDFIVSLESTDDPTRFPVPKDHISLSVTGREESTVRGELRFAGVSCDSVACESFLALWGEMVSSVGGGEGENVRFV